MFPDLPTNKITWDIDWKSFLQLPFQSSYGNRLSWGGSWIFLGYIFFTTRKVYKRVMKSVFKTVSRNKQMLGRIKKEWGQLSVKYLTTSSRIYSVTNARYRMNTQYDTIMQPQTHTQNNMFLEVNMGLSVVISKGTSVMLGLFYDKKSMCGDFPGSPVAKTLHSQCRGLRLDPWSEN